MSARSSVSPLALELREGTLPKTLMWAASRYAPRVAVVDGGRSLTYAALQQRVARFAHGLRSIGVRRGDHVALWMTDCLEWMVARWAVPAIGAILVPINTRLRAEDISYLLSQSDTSVLIMASTYESVSYLDTLEKLIPDYLSQDRHAWRARCFPNLRHVVISTAARCLRRCMTLP